MISVILEIAACVIAALFGIAGVLIGLSYESTITILVSGTLCSIVVIYLSMLAEVMQGNRAGHRVTICKVLNKLIYVTIVAQVISAATMV